MSTLAIVLLICLVCHIIGDGYFQTRQMAEAKSASPLVLFHHICTLSVVLLFGLCAFVPIGLLVPILMINGAIHFVIDGTIWNLYKLKVKVRAKKEFAGLREDFDCWLIRDYIPNFAYWKDPTFYNFILIDQALHFLTFVILFGVIYVN